MKTLPFLCRLLGLLFVSSFVGGANVRAEKPGPPDFSTPQGTLKAVVAAVMAKDIEAYKACFTEKAIEDEEAGLEELKNKPEETWADLQGIFKGPQNIASLQLEGDSAKLDVEAPEAEQGGIGGMSLKKVEGAWKIDRW